MDARAIGLILVWIGTILLVAVLQHRIRKGAFSERALDEGPPLGRWSVAFSVAGVVLALVGAAFTVWSLL